MKKLTIMFLALILAVGAFAQKESKMYNIAAFTSKISRSTGIQKDDLLRTLDSNKIYRMTRTLPANTTLSAEWAAGYATVITYSSVNATYVDTITNQTIHGNKTFAHPVAMTSTLAVTGATNLTGAVGIGASNNKVTIAAATGNTVIAGTLDVTGAVAGSSTIIGTAIGVSGTDTVTTAPIGTICYRAADSTLWIKINTVGPKSARWNKISKGK